VRIFEESSVELSYSGAETRSASRNVCVSLDPLEPVRFLCCKIELDFLLGLELRAIPKNILGRRGLGVF
jgi:hypothetical protein